MNQAWRQHQLFLLGKCCKLPVLSDTALCLPVGKFCKGSTHWVPHSPGTISHGGSTKPWGTFLFLLNCARILDSMSSPNSLEQALCKLAPSSSFVDFSSLLEYFLPSLPPSVQHPSACSPVGSYIVLILALFPTKIHCLKILLSNWNR